MSQITTSAEPALSANQLREFVTEKARNFQALLAGDRVVAKQALRDHIDHLVLTPRHTPEGDVIEVSGDVNLFAPDPGVMLNNSVPGTISITLCR